MKETTKVLHLLSSDRFSGAENVACQIIEMMKGPRFEMAYCSPDGPIKEALRDRGIPFFPLKNLAVSEVRRVIRAFGPDIVHAHDARASAVASIAGGDKRIISHMHVNNEKMKRTNARTLAYLACSIRFEKILWVSRSSLEGCRFSRQLAPISMVLYNVLDPGPVLAKAAGEEAKERYDVVFIGRMTAQKDPARLMRVLRLAAGLVPELRAAVIGEGELLDATRKMAAQAGLLKNVSFLGYLANPLPILKAAKLLVMTSRFEGTPICALEAMILGVPIVSTPADGMADLVCDGENGFLETEDGALAEKIALLLKDGGIRERMSRRAQEKAAEFGRISDYRETLLRVYSM